MENEEIISVIMPVYNREKFVTTAIESVLNQSFKNLELIIVDDGSTDGTLELCNKYRDCKNVKIFTNENHGCSYSRNFGMEKASGKYLMFMDSDDWIEPDMIKRMYDRMKEEDSDVVICGVSMESSNHIDVMIPKLDKNGYSWFSDRALVANPVNKLFKCEIIEKENLKFPEDIRFGEDLCFSVFYLLNCKKISLVRSALYHYILHDGNSINSFEKRKDIFKVFGKIYSYICEKNLVKEKALMRRLKKISREHIQTTFENLLNSGQDFDTYYEEYKKAYYENINFFDIWNKIYLKAYMNLILFCFKHNVQFILKLKFWLKGFLKATLLKPYILWRDRQEKN